jgi:hypothetical protein
MSSRSNKVDGSNPNVRLSGESDSPQNKLRGELYRSAFERMDRGLEEERFFEVIAIADSVITDRIQSVIQTIIHEEPEQYTHTAIGTAIQSLFTEIKSRNIQLDSEFIDKIKEIDSGTKWIKRRNDVTHGFVVVTPKTLDHTIEDRQRDLRETAEQGARYAREVTRTADKVIRDLKREG